MTESAFRAERDRCQQHHAELIEQRCGRDDGEQCCLPDVRADQDGLAPRAVDPYSGDESEEHHRQVLSGDEPTHLARVGFEKQNGRERQCDCRDLRADERHRPAQPEFAELRSQ
jgi:hypothetical protein